MSASSASACSRTPTSPSSASAGSSSPRRESSEARLLLARASTESQTARIGDQTGGRVFLFLYTDDFWRDYRAYRERGVVFVREPREEPYGTVAVFEDVYGNRWDLLQPSATPGPLVAAS